jgi:hypothetical protein
MTLRYMRDLATGLVTLLPNPFRRCRSNCFDTEAQRKMAARFECAFEAGEQNSPVALTKEKAAEIAADFMTTFYHVQVGALETKFRTMSVPFWLICFFREPDAGGSDHIFTL